MNETLTSWFPRFCDPYQSKKEGEWVTPAHCWVINSRTLRRSVMLSVHVQHVSLPRTSQSVSTTVGSLRGQRVYIPCTAPMVTHQGKIPEVHSRPIPLLSHPPIHPPIRAQHHPTLMLRGRRSVNRLPHKCPRLIRTVFRWDSSPSPETHLNDTPPRIQTRPSSSSRPFHS